MNQVHRTIIRYIQEAAVDSELTARFASMSDEQIVRRMFSNYRGQRGLRLTHFGLQVMQSYFRGYEIAMPEEEKLLPVHLVFLDDRATMPYYLDEKKRIIVVYDWLLGVKLRLVDGRLSMLIEIEME